MPSDRIAERILRFVHAKREIPQRLEEVARALGIAEDEQGDFHAACRALMRSGRIVLGAGDALMVPESPDKITGTYRANAKGFGFVVPEAPYAHGDLYIPSGSSLDALTGDTVVARLQRRGKGDRLSEGQIVAVVKRGQSKLVGELHHEGRQWFVMPDGNTLHIPIQVGDPRVKGARPGDQVVVEIVQYPAGKLEATGVIVKVLGRRGDPGVDTLSIIEQYGFPVDFPEPVLAEARDVGRNFDAAAHGRDREDLRKLDILTIDPIDARDFDDAISIQPMGNGTVELGVHIADVSHFVPAGGALDEEARLRANSVYLPRLVIPMLPEVLSNGVCSLQERQSRLTKSTFITYDGNGQVINARFANTIIRSMKRLAYEQVDAILGGKRGRMSAKVVALLQEADRLARVIRKRRLAEGMLVLDLPEVEPVFDDDGRFIDVAPAGQGFSHTIIEMFMVEANEAVARLLRSLKVPHLRRIHDARTDVSDGSLQRFLRVLGFDLPKRADRFDLQRLLDDARGRPEGFAVHLAVLRSMKQAEYSPAFVGHYALASEHYCHFTSPIRRYPDLTIHRLLDLYLRGQLLESHRIPAMRRDVPTDEELAGLGTHCGICERRAEAAERELMLVLVLRLLLQRLGETEAGIVTGVANVGVYVQLERYLIDGLLKFADLPDDWWKIDPSRGAVVGQRSGRRIQVGDRVKVTISRVHLPMRQLDLALAEPLSSWKKRSDRKPNKKHVQRSRGGTRRVRRRSSAR